jgi:hypothetical protein
MEIELILRGYPSRKRFAEWQQANSLPESELPALSDDQRERAQRLHISERDLAVAVKAAELAGDRALKKMERVGNIIARAVKDRDPEAELTTVLWDFYEQKFEFCTRHKIGQDFYRQCVSSIPTQVVDDLVLEKEGAERRLREAVSSELSVLVE